MAGESRDWAQAYIDQIEGLRPMAPTAAFLSLREHPTFGPALQAGAVGPTWNLGTWEYVWQNQDRSLCLRTWIDGTLSLSRIVQYGTDQVHEWTIGSGSTVRAFPSWWQWFHEQESL